MGAAAEDLGHAVLQHEVGIRPQHRRQGAADGFAGVPKAPRAPPGAAVVGQHGLVAQPLHGELVQGLGMGQVGGHLERGGLIAGNRLVRMAADGRRLLLGVLGIQD